jgi:hypothetical protein
MLDMLLHAADQDYSSFPFTNPYGGTVGIITYIVTVIGMWPTFTKAGWPGWMAIIPIVNVYVVVKLAGYHGATILLYLIPIVNLIWGIIVAVKVAGNFDKGGAFGFFLVWLLAPIGYLILGYGSARYRGPARDV